MAKDFSNAGLKVQDNDGNTAKFMGLSEDDQVKIKNAVIQTQYNTTAIKKLKDYLLAGGSPGSPIVSDASDTVKGGVYLTDDPKAEKDAATGVTAATPKAIQAAVDELKSQIEGGEVTVPGGGSGGASVSTATDAVKGIAFLTDVISADKDAATGATALTPKGAQALKLSLDAIDKVINGDPDAEPPTPGLSADLDEVLEDLYGPKDPESGEHQGGGLMDEIYGPVGEDGEHQGGGLIDKVEQGGGSGPSVPTGTINTPTITMASTTDVADGPVLTGSAFESVPNDGSSFDTLMLVEWKITTKAAPETNVWTQNDASGTTVISVPKGVLKTSTTYVASVRYRGVNFGYSDWGSVEFTTAAAFYTIDAPSVSVTGAPNKVPRSPTITASAFVGTDTFQGTNWKVTSADGSTVWETFTATSSVTVPQGKLHEATQYTFHAQYKGINGTLSDWGKAIATTLDSFVIAGDAGKPGEAGFGVGVAPSEAYESLNLKPLAGTEDPTSFQYGLYEATAPEDKDESGTTNKYQTYHAYLKFFPKVYHCFLSSDDNTLLDDTGLKALIPYTGLTLEQMKEAQRRGGTSAIALAPATAFENEEDANDHGFILNRGFYDDNKAKSGFFLANTITSYFKSSDQNNNNEIQYYCGMPSYNFEPVYRYTARREQGMMRLDGATPTKQFGISSNFQGAIDLGRKFKGCNCMSIGQWQVVCMMAYAAGLYCKDNSECAWYANGYNACPCGINTSGNKDDRDATVTCSPTVNESHGTIWVPEDEYPKTTHNGRISGITNCNGWLYQVVLGADLKWKSAALSMKLADVANGFDELRTNAFSYNGGLSTQNSYYWGNSMLNQPIARSAVHDSKWAGAFAFPVTTSRSAAFGSSQFGDDLCYRYTGSSSAALTVGGYWYNGAGAGLFYRNYGGYGNGWSRSNSSCGFRVGGYPEL